MFIEIVLCARIGMDVRNLEMNETVIKSTCKPSGLVFSNWGMVASGTEAEKGGNGCWGQRAPVGEWSQGGFQLLLGQILFLNFPVTLFLFSRGVCVCLW